MIQRVEEQTKRKNPYEETGIQGRGRLWYDEANYAADALLVTGIGDNAERCKFLAIQRRDGTWGTPGGFHDRGESSREAALRELGEEAVANVNLVARRFQGEAACIYEGYGPDPRNTDDAWIETSLYLFTLPPRVADELVIAAGDDAIDARWIDESEMDAYAWYASHKGRIQEGLKIYKSKTQ